MFVNLVWTTVRGFLMGAADIVPGVSGGTIALILGIYERLIASVRAGSSALGRLLTGDFSEFRRWMGVVDWAFIVPLGAGILLAVLTLAHLLERLLLEQPVLMASLFLGLVVGSIVVAWKLLEDSNATHVFVILAVGFGVFLVLGIPGGTSQDSVAQLAEPALWAFFVSGAIAISAMILPGISGSFILVVLGMYGPVLAAVTGRDVAALAVFTIGAVVGLALFSQILHRALTLHHDMVLAVLIGIMAGSLRVLWPWPLGVGSTALGAPDSYLAESVAVALTAFLLVVWISGFAQRFASSEALAVDPD
jgi:putative membrane protein